MKKGVLFSIIWAVNCMPIMAYELKMDTVSIVNSDGQTNQIIVSINNTEDEPIWIWFVNTEDNREDSVIIKDHLMKRRGDFSLFDIATDPNMEGKLISYPVTADTFFNLFVKFLKPRQSFTVVFLVDNKETALLEPNKRIKIYTQQQIDKKCAGIETGYGINRISYPHNAVVIKTDSGTL